MIFRLKLGAARLLRLVTRALGRGGGTTAPGRLLLALDRGAIRRLRARLGDGAIVVSATNGKTTTASMIARVMRLGGREVVHNRAGSNMHWGVATALLDAGRSPRELGLFEVDEAWLPQVADELDPRAFVLGNLFRDQLDRYGELELLAGRWEGMVEARAGRSALVLNADDPLVADLGRERPQVTYFGIEDDSQRLPAMQHAADSKRCRNCGADYEYAAVYLGHLGRYACPGCGRSRPAPQVAAVRVRLLGMQGTEVELATPIGRIEATLPLPGLYNVYNALAAAAAAVALGATADQVTEGLESVEAAFGRVERLALNGRPVAILLVKNPVGANEVLRTLSLEPGELDLWLALNDGIADGRDVSWIWDVDFEVLAGRVAHVTCSGNRAEEMAMRLKYAGVNVPMTVDRDLAGSLDAAVADGNGDGRTLYALPTYTALLELRDLLAARGVAEPWSE